MTFIKIAIVALSLGSFLTSCETASSSDIVVLPTNLEFSVEQSAENPGLVTVNATADRANFFRFYFGDSQDYVEQKEGETTHTYSETGEYTLTVQAHATVSDFISESTQVNVVLPEPPNGIPSTGYTTPSSYEGYELVWQDEFDGDELSSDWTFEIGTGSNGWGNNELQYYRQENTTVKDGYAIIEAREQNFGDRDYTSSRVITKGKQSFQYGRIDIRAALPYGQGIWPALWMLGGNFSEVGWPHCGELDIMEMIGGSGRENTIHGTIHWQSDEGYASYGNSNSLGSGTFHDEFHVFSIVWDSESIKWYRDDILFSEVDITPGHMTEFHQEFFFIMNVAVGGNWPGNPNASTVFPQRMIVDYIRVFQEE